MTEDETDGDSGSDSQAATPPDKSRPANEVRGAFGEEMHIDVLSPTKDVLSEERKEKEAAKRPVTVNKTTLTQEAGNDDEETDDDDDDEL